MVELAARLIGLERLVPVGRDGERVPADDDRVRLLRLPELREPVREARDRVVANVLRAAVVRAVGERVAVEREQHAQSDASSSAMRAIRRSSLPAQPRRSPAAQVVDVDGRAVRDAKLARGAAGRRFRAPRRARAARRPRARCVRRRCAAAPRASSSALSRRRVPSGNIATTCPSRASRIAVSIATVSCCPRRTGNAPAPSIDLAQREPVQLRLRHEAQEPSSARAASRAARGRSSRGGCTASTQPPSGMCSLPVERSRNRPYRRGQVAAAITL